MHIPYSELDLKMALFGLNNEEEKLNSILNSPELEELRKKIDCSGAEINKAAAAHHGISVEILVGSQSYKDLIQVYKDTLNEEFIKIIQSLGLTKKQAYAVIAVAAGLIQINTED